MKSSKIKAELRKITDLEHQISAIYDAAEVPVGEMDRAKHRKEIEEYIDGVELKLVALEAHVSTLRSPSDLGHIPDPEPSTRDISEAIKASNLGFSKLKLDCPNFEGNKNDKCRYKELSFKFKSVMAGCGNVSDKYKLQFLQSKCVGEAGQYIQHLG